MTRTNNELIIPFTGLKLGIHSFEIEVGNAFFEAIEYSLVEKGSVKLDFELEKKETMMIGVFRIHGNVNASCDRCGEEMSLPIKGEYKLIFKFGGEQSEDEGLVVLPEEEHQIDLTTYIHEFISVSLPSRKVHPEGKCDEEAMSLLDQYSIGHRNNEDDEDDEDIDPRWSELKKLK